MRVQATNAKNNTEKIIWSKGVVIYKDDKPYRFRGTVMDVTEKQSLVDTANCRTAKTL